MLIERPIININRVVGTMLSHGDPRHARPRAMDDTIHVKLAGLLDKVLGHG